MQPPVAADFELVPAAPFTLNYDAASYTATLVPALIGGTTYMLKMKSSLKDLAGNTLTAVNVSFISQDAAPFRVDVDGTTQHTQFTLAFDSSGNGVAAWVATGHGVLVSTFDPASDTWSVAQLVVSSSSTNSLEIALISNGTAFALVAENRGELYALVARKNATWEPSNLNATLLDTTAAGLPRLAGRSTDLLLVYPRTDNTVVSLARTNAATSWGAPVTLPIVGPITELAVASDGTAYGAVAVSAADNTDKDVMLTLSTDAGATWRAAETLDTANTRPAAVSLIAGAPGFFSTHTGFSGIYAARVKVAASVYQPVEASVLISSSSRPSQVVRVSNGYMLVAPGGSVIYTELCLDASASCSTTTLQTVAALGTVDEDAPVAVSAANAVAIAWKDATSGALQVRRYQGGTWQAIESLTTDAVDTMIMASRSTRHHIIYTRKKLNGGSTLWIRFFDGTVWNAETQQDTATDTVGAFAIAAADFDRTTAGPFIKVWAEDKTVKANTGGQSAAVPLIAAPYLGQPSNLRVARASNGDSCIVWQETTAAGRRVFARFIGATVSNIVPVSPHLASTPDVALAAGEGRCVVAVGLSAVIATVVTVFNNTAWTPSVVRLVAGAHVRMLSKSAMLLGTSEDLTAGTYGVYAQQYAFGNGTWESPQTLVTGTGSAQTEASFDYEDQVAFAWSVGDKLRVAIYDGENWGAVQNISGTGDGPDYVSFAHDAGGFALAFMATNHPSTNTRRIQYVSSTNNVFGSPSFVDSGSEALSSGLSFLANDAFSFVSYRTSAGFSTRTLTGSTWSAPTLRCDGPISVSSVVANEVRQLCLNSDDAMSHIAFSPAAIATRGQSAPTNLTIAAFSGGDALHYTSDGTLRVAGFNGKWNAPRVLAQSVGTLVDASTATNRGVLYTSGTGYPNSLQFIAGFAIE
jgi:hypothetical protein